jgi:AcrR family transcriptional regulator
MAKLKAKTSTRARPKDTGIQDGRRLRTEESRRKVAAAMLDCVRDGDFDPSADTVAARAGVGLRTVFRLFKDKEGLIRHMSETVRAQIALTANAPFKGETWRERLDEMMKRRFTAFEQVMPYRRAAQAQIHNSAVVRANNQTIQNALRRALEAVLPPDILADRPTFEAIDMALGVDVWIRLRIDQRLKPAQARATLQRVVSALLNGAA